MILRAFYIRLVIRVVVLGLLMLFFFFSLQQGEMYMALTVSGIMIVVMLADIVFFLNRTNREVANFMLGMKHGEFTSNIPGSGRRHSFERLRDAFSEIEQKFQDVRIREEVHYRYLQTLIEHVEIALVSFDEEGKIELYNSAAAALFKLNKPQRTEQLKRVSPALYNTITILPSGMKEIVRTEIEGQMVHLAVLTSEFRTGDRLYRLASIQDIKSELEEQELDSWQKLIRVLTHEIMNTVTPISSLSDSISRVLFDPEGKKVPPDKIGRDDLEDLYSGIRGIRGRSRGLLGFITNYKSLTQLPLPVFADHGLEEIIDSVCRLKKKEMEKQGISLSLKLHDPNAKIFADRAMMEQLMMNLVINAMDALKDVANPKIEIGSYKKDGRLRITIRDNGSGIAPEKMDRIFIPFYTTKKDGSGIGLSLARQIMRLHKGSIAVQNSKEYGTEFILSF